MAEATPNVTLSSVDPTALKDMVHSKHLSEAQKIEEATRQFEAVMLGMILKESMQSQSEGYLNPSGANKNIYGTLVTEMLADSLSQTNQFGLSTSLQAQIKPQSSSSNEHTN